MFDALSVAFAQALPEHLGRAHAALAEHDLRRLAAAAHTLAGTLGAFSTTAGALALTLEGAANREEEESCKELVSQLDAMCKELMEDTRGLTLSSLDL